MKILLLEDDSVSLCEQQQSFFNASANDLQYPNSNASIRKP
ncbi:hypothetical protein [Shewanella fodinae]|nr:hypothetical protein [Shewanella fodinae]